jgi:hypothetical protein
MKREIEEIEVCLLFKKIKTSLTKKIIIQFIVYQI